MNNYPLRILHMIGSLNMGGSQSMIINLYKNLDKSKIQFDFVIDHENETYFKELVLELGAKVYISPSFNGHNILTIKKFWKNFFNNHKEYKILHCHVRSYASLFLPIARKKGITTIIHSHSTSNGKGFKAFIKSLLQFPLRWNADYYLACSPEAGKWLFGKRIVKSPKFSLINNAIYVDKYKYKDLKRIELRNLYNIAEDEYVFVNVGRFHPTKNHSFLIDLFYRIHSIDSKTKLLLVGDGDLRSEIEKDINSKSLSNNVILTGNVDNPYDYLNAGDCFLFPSIWEGLGMVAIEAQTNGLKCICNTSIPKEVKISDNCFFISTSNIDGWIIKAMDYKYDRKKDCSQLAIDKGYDIRETCKRMTLFYEDIIKND